MNLKLEQGISSELSLEKKIRMYEAREAILGRINPEIRSVIDMDNFLQAFVDELGKMFDADRCDFLMYSSERHLRITHEWRRDGSIPSSLGTEIPIGNPAADLSRLTASPLGIQDTSAGTTPAIIRTICQPLQTRSLLIAPIAFQKQLLGALNLHFCRTLHSWREEEINFIHSIAVQIAIAYRYVLLFNEKEREVKKTSMLLDVSNELNSRKTPREITTFLVNKTMQEFKADYGCIGEMNHAERVLRFGEVHHRLQTHLSPPHQETISYREHRSLYEKILERQVLQSGAATLPGELHAFLRGVFQSREALMAPIVIGDRLYGTLLLGWSGQSPEIDSYEIDLIKGLCNQAALALENHELTEEVVRLKRELKGVRAGARIIGTSEKIRKCIDDSLSVADAMTTVLISGESGVGKELIADLIQQNSPRMAQPYLKINCGAIPETLLESELFGHEKGAFTDARMRKIGKFEEAHLGTLFLDEVGELSLSAQVKLLRVLQNGSFHRVGGNETIHCDVRIIAATNRDLEQAVMEGRFRNDLMFRLKVYPITVPPLRDRVEDIADLARHFLAVHSRKNRRNVKSITDKALRALMGYPWPGNIRELENVIECAVIVAQEGEIRWEDLPEGMRTGLPGQKEGQEKILEITLGTSMEEIEKKVILQTLQMTGGVKQKAVDILKIGRKTLYRKLESYLPKEAPAREDGSDSEP